MGKARPPSTNSGSRSQCIWDSTRKRSIARKSPGSEPCGLVVLTVSITPGIISSRLFSHTLRGLVVLVVSVTPGVVSSRLFSHALRGLVALAVSVTPGVVSLRLFSHALRGLVVLAVSVMPSMVSSWLFSHALCRLVVLAVSVTPGVVFSRLFSHALRGLVVLGRAGRSAGHGDREEGLWREIIFNVFLLRSGLQPIYAPPRHTTPMGLPSFATARKSKTKNRSK